MDYFALAQLYTQQNNLKVEADREENFRQGLLRQAAQEAQAERDYLASKTAERKAAGEAGRTGVVTNIQNLLSQGRIGYEKASQDIEDYYTKYDLSPASIGADLDAINKTYGEYAPKKKTSDINVSFQRLLKRKPTEQELKDEYFNRQDTTITDIQEFIKDNAEYKKQLPPSAEAARLETIYGGPVLDETGTRTGKYKFNFGGGTLPQLSSDLVAKSGVKTPDFIGKEFTGSAEEIEFAKQSKNNYETFMYNSGLKSLEGNIQTELTKLQTEGQLKINRQSQQAGLLQGLVGSFSFA